MTDHGTRWIHRFWAGHPMPPEYVRYGQLWTAYNPDWVVKDWTMTEALRWTSGPCLEVIEDLKKRDGGRNGIELWTQVADVVGYNLIYQLGGLYVNVDIEPLKPMTELFRLYHPGDAPYASFEDQNGAVSNAVLGGPRNNPFWEFVVDGLPKHYFADPTGEMNQTTGPRYLTKAFVVWNSERSHEHHLHVLPEIAFNPVHWRKIQFGGDASGMFDPATLPMSVAVHHWGHKKVGRTNYIESATQPPEFWRE